jgi:hypothetical protein
MAPKIPNTELAERLGVSEAVIRRMLNPKHNTKPEKTGRAAALGASIAGTKCGSLPAPLAPPGPFEVSGVHISQGAEERRR